MPPPPSTPSEGGGGGRKASTRNTTNNPTPSATPDTSESNLFPDATSARTHLIKSKWIIEDETLTNLKLADLLLTAAAAAASKTSPVSTANLIKAIAVILRDEHDRKVTELVTTDVSNATTNAIEKQLEPAIDAIDHASSKLSSSLSFLEAISKDLATQVLSMKDTTAALPPAPTWANIAATPPHHAGPPFQAARSPNEVKMIQRTRLAARRVNITYSENDTDAPARTQDGLKALKDKINEALTTAAATNRNFPANLDTSKPPLISVASPQAGLLILELRDPAYRDWILTFNEYDFNFITESASIKPPSYNLICKFVPCTGDFDPDSISCRNELASRHSLPPNSITSAAWIKDPNNRAPGQQVANLRIACSTPEAANKLLTEEVIIDDRVVTVMKDKREPIRCSKCQLYGHVKATCTAESPRCSTCAKTDHPSSSCSNRNLPSCVNCGPTSTHPSHSRECPDFTRRCKELDSRLHENSLPYFPTAEPWTWSSHSHTPPPPAASPPPITIIPTGSNQKQRRNANNTTNPHFTAPSRSPSRDPRSRTRHPLPPRPPTPASQPIPPPTTVTPPTPTQTQSSTSTPPAVPRSSHSRTPSQSRRQTTIHEAFQNTPSTQPT